MNSSATSTYTMTFPCAGTSALKPVSLVRLDVVAGGLSSNANVRPSQVLQNRASQKCAVRANHAPQAANISSKERLFALTASIMLITLLSFGWLMSNQAIAAKRSHIIASTAKTTCVVTPGDSLWSIAEDHGISGFETADVVSWIREANDMSTATLMPGDVIVVPA